MVVVGECRGVLGRSVMARARALMRLVRVRWVALTRSCCLVRKVQGVRSMWARRMSEDVVRAVSRMLRLRLARAQGFRQ